MIFECEFLKVEVKEIDGTLTKVVTIKTDKLNEKKEKRIPCSKYKKECEKCLMTIDVNELKEKGWR